MPRSGLLTASGHCFLLFKNIQRYVVEASFTPIMVRSKLSVLLTSSGMPDSSLTEFSTYHPPVKIL